MRPDFGEHDECEPRKRALRRRAIGRTKGGLHFKLQTVSDGGGRPLSFLLSLDQMSDAKGALGLRAKLRRAKGLLRDKGYDADWP